jgi:hypothetical protein
MVAIAGMLRARGRFVDDDSWRWIADMAGQRVFRPPNVSGWDESRWLDTSTFRGRWYATSRILDRDELSTAGYSETETAEEALERALRYWGEPTLTPATREGLVAFGQAVEDAIAANWQQSSYRALRQNALRLLLATSPDMQAS